MLAVNKITLVNLAFSSALFVIGIVAGKLINWPFFEVDEKVNVLHLLSISSTILIAIFVSRIINKETQECRVEKDLLIQKLGGITKSLEMTHSDISTKNISYSSAAASIKRLSTGLTHIIKITKKIPISIEEGLYEEIISTTSELKVKLTDTPPISKTAINATNLPLEVKDGILTIHKDRLILIDGIIDKLKNKIFAFQLEINKG